MRDSWAVFGTMTVVAVLAGDAAADVAFDSGTIRGTVATTSGVVPPGATVQAHDVLGGPGVSTAADPITGAFELQFIPVGDYVVEAFYGQARVGTSTITLTVGENEIVDFRFAAGYVSAQVSRDAAPDAGASLRVTDTAVPPGCLAPGATCQPGSTLESCACTFEMRFYTCDPGGACRYWERYSYSASTDATGLARVLVPAGPWEADVYSSSPFDVDGQSGSVRVAPPTGVNVGAGDDILAVSVDYQTGILAGSVTANGQPLTGVLVTASSPDGTISVPVDAAGNYSLTLPVVGPYTLAAVQDGATVIGTYENVTPVASSSTPYNFAITGAKVSGDVVRDGVPAVNAVVVLELAPPTFPTACAAEGCQLSPGDDDSCYCPNGGAPYVCEELQPDVVTCRWLMAPRVSTYTDGSGHFEKFVAPGIYNVEIGAAPVPGVEQYGYLVVDRRSAVAVATTPVALGTFSYVTGEASGDVTSCGLPVVHASVALSNENGSIGTDGIAGMGSFFLRAPEGSYSLTASLFGAMLATTQRTIAAGTPVTWSLTVDLGGIRGTILRDGQPSQFSPVQVTEIPEGLACSAACGFVDPLGSGVCFECPSPDGRTFGCFPEPGGAIRCQIGPPRFYFATTGEDGIFQIDNVLPGLYHVVTSSGGVGGGGQSGGIPVGEFDIRVEACELAQVNTSDTPVPAGSNVEVTLGDGIELTFLSTVDAGTATFNATSTPPPAEPAPAFQSAGLYYDIFVPSFTGSVEICLPYDVDAASTDLRLYHSVGGVWEDITTSVDTTNHIVCGITTSFSWFTVGTRTAPTPTLTITAPAHVTANDDCLAPVTLVGGGEYDWYLGNEPLGHGTTLEVVLPLGEHTITATLGTQSGTTTVAVVDETAPTFSVTASPAVLWPPNGKLVPVTPNPSVRDNCDPAPAISIVEVSATSGVPTDISHSGNSLAVRAFRDGRETAGRTYTIQYAATDRAGNSTRATTSVHVPHDRR